MGLFVSRTNCLFRTIYIILWRRYMAANYDEAIVKVFLELEKLFTDNFKNLPTSTRK